jgi:hypothetical protein
MLSFIYAPINTVRCLESLILTKFRLPSGNRTVSFAAQSSFFFHGSTAMVGLGLLIVEVSRSHSVGRTSLEE